ncbi:MAG: hypothetical protein U0930_04870 [Pirellulales bacterium]
MPLPGGSNTYIRDFQSSGKLIVNFSRNPKRFDLANYCQVKTVTKDEGYYLKINCEQAGRLVGGSTDEANWPDSADRPDHNDGTEQFNWLPFKTRRKAYGFKLGQKATEQADFDIHGTHMAITAQRAMTGRTVDVVKVLTNAANWDATHVKDVTTIAGNSGRWDLSTTARQDIKRSLNYACELIETDTLAAVDYEQLHLVMSPNTARKLSITQEIVDHIKGSPDALAQVKGEQGKFYKYGLPDKLYSIPLAIERAVMVTSRRGAATPVKQRVMPDGVAFLLSKVGELGSELDGPEFSTICLFCYEEMTVETKDDTDNRRKKGSIVDDYGAVITAPATGFYFQNIA